MQQQSITALIDPWTKVGRVIVNDSTAINRQYLVFVVDGKLQKRPIGTGIYSSTFETCKRIIYKQKQYYIDVTAIPMSLVGLSTESLQVL